MNRAPHRLGHDAARVAGPDPGTVVFPLERARPGTRDTDLPIFGDLRWQLAALDHGESGKALKPAAHVSGVGVLRSLAVRAPDLPA